MDAFTIIRKLLAEQDEIPMKGWTGLAGTNPSHRFRAPNRDIWAIEIQREGNNHHIASIKRVGTPTHERQDVPPEHGAKVAGRAIAGLHQYIKNAVKPGDTVSFTPEAGDLLEKRRGELGDQLMRRHGLHPVKPVMTRLRNIFVGTTKRTYIKR